MKRYGILGAGEVGQVLAKGRQRRRGGEAVNGKAIIDTTSPMSDEPHEDGVLRWFTGPNESWMERLQAAYPEARFVKAFNSVGSDRMVDPKFTGGPTTMFYCGNDAGAKAEVARILEQFRGSCGTSGLTRSRWFGIEGLSGSARCIRATLSRCKPHPRALGVGMASGRPGVGPTGGRA